MTTRRLAEFIVNLHYEDLAPMTVAKAKQCILDWLGVCIRGSQEKPIKILREVLLGETTGGEVSIFAGAGQKTTALTAAFCNGAASHALDFDDLHNPSIIHLATVVIPPSFALAQAEHKTGKELLTAVVAGYEIGARVGEAVIPESYFYWHTTGTAGTFGAAAAAAKLLDLDSEASCQCLGSAGTQAAGLWEFLKEGAMSKTLHAGKSSYAGVLSAYLAQKGFSGATKIIEGEKGFCRAMSAAPHFSKLTEGLGDSYKIDDNSFKPYACCKHSHAALYALETFVRGHELTAREIESVEIYVNNITDFLINNPNPQNSYGCKFSLQYCAAGMLKYGKMRVEEFADEIINDKDVRKLMKKITVIKDDAMEAIHAEDSSKLASRVVVNCYDGRIMELRVDYPKGDPPNPMSWEDTVEKFINLVVPVYGELVAQRLVQLIAALDEVEDFAVAIKEGIGESDD